MRAKVHGIERNIADHPEHVEHYIETLDGQKRKCNLAASSSKFRSRSASPYTPSPSKPARAVLAIHVGGDSSSSESNIIGSDSDEEHRRVYVTTAADQTMNRANERPTKPRLATGSVIRMVQEDTSRALIMGRKDMVIVDAGNG